MSILFLHLPLSLLNLQRISAAAASVSTALANYMSTGENNVKYNLHFLFKTMGERKAELMGRVMPKYSSVIVLGFVCCF